MSLQVGDSLAQISIKDPPICSSNQNFSFILEFETSKGRGRKTSFMKYFGPIISFDVLDFFLTKGCKKTDLYKSRMEGPMGPPNHLTLRRTFKKNWQQLGFCPNQGGESDRIPTFCQNLPKLDLPCNCL